MSPDLQGLIPCKAISVLVRERTDGLGAPPPKGEPEVG